MTEKEPSVMLLLAEERRRSGNVWHLAGQGDQAEIDYLLTRFSVERGYPRTIIVSTADAGSPHD